MNTYNKDLRMYILINKDIELSKGKVAGQVGHAVASFFYNINNKPLLTDYMEHEQKKIILSCPQSKLEELEQLGYITIRDKGYTEIEPNTLTCVNFGIWDVNDENHPLPKWIKRLKLYK